VNRIAARGVWGTCLITSALFAQAGSSRETPNPQAAELIARVKDVSASRLEKGLPAVRFEDWVRSTAGPDWSISWIFSQGAKNAGFPDCVDIRGVTKDDRYFRLSVGTTMNANQVFLFWVDGAAKLRQKWVGLEHLSQLPRLPSGVGQKVHSPGVQK